MLPDLSRAESALRRIPKQYIFAFAAACIFFAVFHAGFFDDRMVNEDYRHLITANWQRIQYGRFFCFYLITSYCNAWTLGCETCLYFALTTVLLVDLFKVRTKIGITLVAALAVGMPSLCFMFGYLAAAPLYGRLYFLAVLSVWVADRWRWGFLPATVLFAVALGVGQSALIAGAVLCVLVLLRDMLLAEPFHYKTLLIKLAKFLFMGILGAALYFALWSIILHIEGLTAVDYKGMSQVGALSFSAILDGIKDSYTDFSGFFFGDRFLYVSRLQKAAYAILFAMVALALIYKAVLRPIIIPGVIAVILLFPLCIGCIQIFVPQVTTDTLMVYPMVYLLVMCVFLIEGSFPDNLLGRGGAWLLLASLLVTCCSFWDISSAFYVQAETYHEQTYAYENRLLSRIEETEGYYPGIPVAIITNGSNDYTGMNPGAFDRTMNQRGMWNPYVGTKDRVLTKTLDLIRMYTGVSLTGATNEQIEEVRNSTEFAELSAFPLNGSIKVINGVLTVNCIYLEAVVMQADDHTLLLNCIDRLSEDNGGEGTYAWYVYRDGVRAPELEREYRTVPEHLITLTEDGSYTFKAFCKNGRGTRTVTSAAVVVKNGVIVESASLKQISMEEAQDRALPAAQVIVTQSGDREIRLGMLDNTLHTGPEYRYAWRVYRDGVHLPELDREFAAEARYDLLLSEDGQYLFELIYRNGSEGREVSVLSEETAVTHLLEVSRAGGNSVLLNYVGPGAEETGASYAWYVYRDGERITELDRAYQSNAAYLLALEEDGIYKFKCFYRCADVKDTALTFSMSVVNGQIIDDPRMSAVSLEEANRLTRPAFEVDVAVFGERAVQLTMIDNTLNAGEDYTYAWYVYCDGERLTEYDRPYLADPEYDLILADDGEYQFKLFVRHGEEKDSVMSEKITIGAAQSGENAA